MAPYPETSTSIDADVTFYSVSSSLDWNITAIMNTDDCFRHFLLDPKGKEHVKFINQTANNIRRPLPAGLSTDVGLVVSNPAYLDNYEKEKTFGYKYYHGTVIWSWPMAMMAAGLERQLNRCLEKHTRTDFCHDTVVFRNVLAAYNHLWDLIEANAKYLQNEVWSWEYINGRFVIASMDQRNLGA